MSLKNALFAHLYFGVQRLRGGVTRDLIREAWGLLEAPRQNLRDRALARLRSIHGKSLTWDALARKPTVDRRSLTPRAERIISEGSRGAAGRPTFEVRKTSGSTGTPFVFPKDRTMTAWMDAVMWAAYDWHGISPGVPHARFWGTPLDSRRRRIQRLRDRLMHRRRIGAFDLSPDTVNEHFQTLRRLDPAYGYGYPTLMSTFVDLCRAEGIDGRALGLEVVISTGEILTPSTREQIADFFGCPVRNEYGCTESGIVAFECKEGALHAVPVAVWPEVVDEEGRPVGDGQEGEIVVSDLFGSTMPLLRYRLHDRGRFIAEPCPCGRDLRRLEVSSGRTDSFIETPGGRVYDAILAYTVPREVQRFKAYQTGPTRLEAEVVPGAGFDENATPARCRNVWEDVLGPDMTVVVRTVEDIPLEKSGKLRYFVPLGADDEPSIEGGSPDDEHDRDH